MSLAVLHSRSLTGMDALAVAVEVHLASGLPSFTLVGLPDAEVREAKDRVRAAIQNSRFEFPQKRITVNLAPADLPKGAGHFDLPIALGILIASGQIPAGNIDEMEFAGELSLSGELRPVRGALAMSLAARNNNRALVLPPESAAEAALARNATILVAPSLLAVAAHFCGSERLTTATAANVCNHPEYPDLAEVKGQGQAKRALEVAAAGGHSLFTECTI